MKILVISLLRMGDVIMATPTLRGLKRRFPSARIDLLYNSQFKGLMPLIPYVDQFVEFDRELLQKGLGQENKSIFESYDRMKTLIQGLRNQKYDLVVNVTHNRLSGYLASSVQAKEVMGLSLDKKGHPRFGSNWFRHLNRYGLDKEGAHFHYSDLFFFGAQLGSRTERFDLKESVNGMKGADLIAGDEDYILIQATTSEIKKNYPLDRLAESIASFRLLNPKLKIHFLAVEAEKQQMEEWIKAKSLSDCQVAVCDLETAFSLLKGCLMLVTVDTGIKHLAAAAGCKIVELSLGSSHYRSTGVYRDGSLIVQSEAECAPCPHSKPCSEKSHVCSEIIPADLLGLIWAKYLDGDREGLKVLAKEGSEEIGVYIVSNHLGYWSAIPIYSENPIQPLSELVDQLSWKLLLEKEHEKRMPQIGSFSEKLSEAFRLSGLGFRNDDLMDNLTVLERTIERFESRADILMIDFQQVLKSKAMHDKISEFVLMLQRVSHDLKSDNALRSYARTIERVLEDTGNNDFSTVRKLRECLVDTKNRIQIEQKIIRSLKNQLVEG
jgi:heptosyltransferase-2